jgi:hypothetical protein
MKQNQVAACTDSAELYDAVGALWLHLFGEHVHVGEIQLSGFQQTVTTSHLQVHSLWGVFPLLTGYYADARLKKKLSWRTAQHAYVTRLLELGGVKAADKVSG